MAAEVPEAARRQVRPLLALVEAIERTHRPTAIAGRAVVCGAPACADDAAWPCDAAELAARVRAVETMARAGSVLCRSCADGQHGWCYGLDCTCDHSALGG